MRKTQRPSCYNTRMKLFITVKPNAGKNEVLQIDTTHYVVKIAEQPVKGRANATLLKELSQYLNQPVSCFSIVRGARSRNKTIEFNNNSTF